MRWSQGICSRSLLTLVGLFCRSSRQSQGICGEGARIPGLQDTGGGGMGGGGGVGGAEIGKDKSAAVGDLAEARGTGVGVVRGTGAGKGKVNRFKNVLALGF
jgi:hypothetical protein